MSEPVKHELTGITVLLRTSVNRGDHSADVREVIPVSADTPIAKVAEDVFHRAIWRGGYGQDGAPYDCIEIMPRYEPVIES